MCNNHKHKEANLKKKKRIPLCSLSAALLVSQYIFRKRVNCSRPPNSLIWTKTRPIHVLVVICRNCRREKSPYPNGPTWVASMFEGVQKQGELYSPDPPAQVINVCYCLFDLDEAQFRWSFVKLPE